jgi:hypothetical protein
MAYALCCIHDWHAAAYRDEHVIIVHRCVKHSGPVSVSLEGTVTNELKDQSKAWRTSLRRDGGPNSQFQSTASDKPCIAARWIGVPKDVVNTSLLLQQRRP